MARRCCGERSCNASIYCSRKGPPNRPSRVSLMITMTKDEKLMNFRKNFSVAGPFCVQPSPQRTPFIFQAGTSKAGKVFAAKHAEAMFIPGMDPNKVRKSIDDIRALASKEVRDPCSIKLLMGILVIVDETDELAQAKYEEYLSYADLEGSLALFGGWTGEDLDKFSDDEDFAFSGPGAIQSIVDSWSSTLPGGKGIKWTKSRVAREMALGGPHPKAIGSPKTVANFLENWVEVTDVDGFNLSYAVSPGGFEDMIKWLFPELKRRGVFWADYTVPGGTTREQYLADGKGPRLREDHPGSKYKWRAGEKHPGVGTKNGFEDGGSPGEIDNPLRAVKRQKTTT